VKASAVRRWTAFHEAGHAVVRLVRTGTATAIDIGVNGHGYSHGTGKETRLVDRIEIALAGPLAEARVRKVSAAVTYTAGGAADFGRAKSAARKWGEAMGGDERAIFAEAEQHARDLLRAYWPAVERVAAAAILRGSLTSSEVAKISAIE
jgi:hypothetical protein